MPPSLKNFLQILKKRMAELEAHAHSLAGREFNVGSPKQLGEILFDEMGLEGGKKGKTGAYSTSADALEDLVIQGHELPKNRFRMATATKTQEHLHGCAGRRDQPRRQGVFIHHLAKLSPRPDAYLQTHQTFKTFQFEQKKAGKSAKHLLPKKAIRLCQPTILKSS